MLLRTSSSPVLKSLNGQCSVSEADPSPRYSQLRPVSMSLQRTSSEGDLKLLSKFKEKEFSKVKEFPSFVAKKTEVMNTCLETTAMSSRWKGSVAEKETASVGGGRGGIPSGGRGSGGGEGFWRSGNGPQETEFMDKYYQDMIMMYPGDALLLANYAKFLKEVRGDAAKAEEYCERAILVNAGDGSVLSTYGDLIWNNHKDGDRAKTYFNQAVKSSPDDCHVLASYARFLWDVREEEEEDEEEEEEKAEKRQFQVGRAETCEPPPPPHNCGIGFGLGRGFPPPTHAS